ncbi:MAG: ferrous iron transport protein A [Thermosynechococcaceae cyanobacterium]
MPTFHLALLKPGQIGTIAKIHAEPGLHQRLNALGFREGQAVTVLRRAWFAGPMHLRIGMTEVMVRCKEARLIGLTPAAIIAA